MRCAWPLGRLLQDLKLDTPDKAHGMAVAEANHRVYLLFDVVMYRRRTPMPSPSLLLSGVLQIWPIKLELQLLQLQLLVLTQFILHALYRWQVSRRPCAVHTEAVLRRSM